MSEEVGMARIGMLPDGLAGNSRALKEAGPM